VIELESVINSIGFSFYHYSGNLRIHGNNNVQHTVSNLPASWKERHMRADGAHDPIRQVAQHRLTPVIFESRKNDSADFACDHEVLNIEGVGIGAIFPIHAHNGDTAVLGLFMRSDCDNIDKIIDLPLGEMSLTAIYFHDAMARTISKSHWEPKAPLTHREIECLQLIANYKSNWVISRILGISEHGVVYYVRRLMWKLDAQNRYQAVERAAAYGLI